MSHKEVFRTAYNFLDQKLSMLSKLKTQQDYDTFWATITKELPQFDQSNDFLCDLIYACVLELERQHLKAHESR